MDKSGKQQSINDLIYYLVNNYIDTKNKDTYNSICYFEKDISQTYKCLLNRDSMNAYIFEMQ